MPIRELPNGLVTPLHVIPVPRSQSTGTGGHLAQESVVTIARNRRSPWPGARNEHDFGSFEIDGERFFFKLDYYDLTRAYLSTDPADPAVTERVMTIMLADEY